jgi:stage II sporulation protein D
VRAITSAGLTGAPGLELPVLLEAPAGRLQIGGTRYRGRVLVQRHGTQLQAINFLPLEEYVAGVVSSEMPGYWPQEALRAQAIASRTYALASLQPAADFDLYSDDRSQNYKGVRKEFPAAIAAVEATRHQTLFYGGRPIKAFFSASNGGLTSGPEGVWGGPQLPYFVSRADPYDAESPLRAWGPIRLPIAQLRHAFTDLPESLSSVEVTYSEAHRALSVAFVATDGASYEVPGAAFQQRLGLRSTYLSIAPERG